MSACILIKGVLSVEALHCIHQIVHEPMSLPLVKHMQLIKASEAGYDGLTILYLLWNHYTQVSLAQILPRSRGEELGSNSSPWLPGHGRPGCSVVYCVTVWCLNCPPPFCIVVHM